MTRVQTRPAHVARAARGPAVHTQAAGRSAPVELTTFLQVSAVSLLFGAALVHGAWTVAHFEEWAAAGLFFLALLVVQTLGGFVLAIAPRRLVCIGIVAVSIGTILVWAVSRLTGLPFGPEAGEPEPVGMPDLICSLFELLTVVAVLPMLRGDGTGAGRMPSRGYLALIGVPACTLVLTFVAIVPAAGHGTEPGIPNPGTHDMQNMPGMDMPGMNMGG